MKLRLYVTLVLLKLYLDQEYHGTPINRTRQFTRRLLERWENYNGNFRTLMPTSPEPVQPFLPSLSLAHTRLEHPRRVGPGLDR